MKPQFFFILSTLFTKKDRIFLCSLNFKGSVILIILQIYFYFESLKYAAESSDSQPASLGVITFSFARHCQLPPKVDGVFMRAAVPRLSTSCIGTITSAEGEA